MEISRRALRRIRELRGVQGLPSKAALRLGLSEDSVVLTWDQRNPAEHDLVLKRHDLPIVVDAETYMHLADYELDFERGAGRKRFLLRHRPA